MKFCQPHWDALRAAIDERGLADLVSGSSAEIVLRLKNDGYDPLMSAHWALVTHLGAAAGDGGMVAVMMLDGCPLCEANRVHREACTDEACTASGRNVAYYDPWIQNAADDELQRAAAAGLIDAAGGEG